MGLVSGLQLGSNVVRVRTQEPCGRSKPAAYEPSDHRADHFRTARAAVLLHDAELSDSRNPTQRASGRRSMRTARPPRASTTCIARPHNTFKALPAGPSYPADLVQTTTTQGKTVPYIVRVETGTINRAIYQTAILHDPMTEAPPTPLSASGGVEPSARLHAGRRLRGRLVYPGHQHRQRRHPRRPAAAPGLRCRVVDAERVRQQLPGGAGGRKPDDGEGALHQELRSARIHDRLRLLRRIGSGHSRSATTIPVCSTA